jgi:hypothetical protein
MLLERFGGGGMHPLRAGEEVYWRWVAIRSRLEAALGEQSGLPAALAAYAVDHVDDLKLDHVRWLREEYGVPSEPSAEGLLTLLEVHDAQPERTPEDRLTLIQQVKDRSDLFGEGYLDEVREGWPGAPE